MRSGDISIIIYSGNNGNVVKDMQEMMSKWDVLNGANAET